MGKKSNIFVALLFPTLTMMSACGNINKSTVKEEFKINEDTYANDELFDNAKMINDYIPDNSEIPAIGIQRSEPDANNKVSIRYIAAIKVVDLNNDKLVNEADVSLTTATWYRGFYDNTNGESLLSDEAKPSNKAYIAFNNGGTRYTIDDYNNDHETSYNYFVTYVLTGVSLTKYAKSYLNAYVVVNNEIYSNSVTTSVDANTQFSFDANKTGYFVLKKTATGFETVDPVKYENVYDNCLAKFEVNKSTSDSLVAIYKNGNDMKVLGYSDIGNLSNNETNPSNDGSSQFIKTGSSNKQSITINGDNVSDAKINIYFTGSEPVRYGLYPQDTYITDENLIEQLNNITTEVLQRVELNGKYYIYTDVTPAGSTAGWYKFKDGTAIANAPKKLWFRLDPIEWKILQSSSFGLMLTTKELLDTSKYGEQGNNFYDQSIMRAMLNPGGFFYDNAFFLGDSLLLENYVDNSSETTGATNNSYACEPTKDKVYALSYSELMSSEYGFSSVSYNNAKRVCITTNWARVRKAYLYDSTNGAGCYWTRSPDFNRSDSAKCVNRSGAMNTLTVTASDYCIRPVIELNAEW